jgi:hypothetical protein
VQVRTNGAKAPAGSAFRRAGATVAVACAVTGTLFGLGSIGALAAPQRTSAHQAAPAPSPDPVASTRPATDPNTAAFFASPYAADAVALAAAWGSPDIATAKARAGADLRNGTALPFPAGEPTRYPFTPEQQRNAFFLGFGDFTQALGLAVAWGIPDVDTVKTTLGAKMIGNFPVPIAPLEYTEAQDVQAFLASGYDEDDAARLAALWQSPSTRAAEIRAGQALLAGDALPI